MQIQGKQIQYRKQNHPTTKVAYTKGISKTNQFGISPKKQSDICDLKPIKEKSHLRQKGQKGLKKKVQKKEKKKKVNYCLNLKQLKPVNLQKEKNLFFSKNFNYNPFFIYPNISDLNDEEYKDTRRFQEPDQTYLGLALRILEKSMQIDMPKWLKKSEILTHEETSKAFDAYISKLQIGHLLTYQFAQNTIAPTSVVHNNQDGLSKVLIGVPINYRTNTIQGVLNHEIGTHFIRKYNDKLQKWFKDRKKYNLTPYLKTEQGLAALNQVCSYIMQASEIPPLLYRAASLYYSCFLASKLPFSKMYEELGRYQPDLELRWRECVRVKRGIADTSKPYGMYKDQIYFLGAVQILQNRRKANFINLHCGKINLEDCLKWSQRGQFFCTEHMKIPHFLYNMKYYQQCLDVIADANQIGLK